jgi:hypothetical protein
MILIDIKIIHYKKSIKIIHYKKSIKNVFHSPEVNNKIKLIGLMAGCMEQILCDTLIVLLIFDFLSAIRKLRHTFSCDVRVLL